MHGGNARLAHLFSCLPTTFVLPKEAQAFVDAFQKAAYGVEPSVTQPKGLNLWWVTHTVRAGAFMCSHGQSRQTSNMAQDFSPHHVPSCS